MTGSQHFHLHCHKLKYVVYSTCWRCLVSHPQKHVIKSLLALSTSATIICVLRGPYIRFIRWSPSERGLNYESHLEASVQGNRGTER
jgi:hypothetical protein